MYVMLERAVKIRAGYRSEWVEYYVENILVQVVGRQAKPIRTVRLKITQNVSNII